MRESQTTISTAPVIISFPLKTTPPSALFEVPNFILYPFEAKSFKALSTVRAESIFNIPTVGYSIPQALAVIIPYTAFLNIACSLIVAEVPVVVAIKVSLPLA